MLKFEEGRIHTHLGGDENPIAGEDRAETAPGSGSPLFPGAEERVVLQRGVDPHNGFLGAGFLCGGVAGKDGKRHREGEGGKGKSKK